jgi:hypothetical protein
VFAGQMLPSLHNEEAGERQPAKSGSDSMTAMRRAAIKPTSRQSPVDSIEQALVDQ